MVIDDEEVSGALFRTVEDYARQMGCSEIHGPLGFTDLDRKGMLVDGFERRSMFITYYNHPYYLDHLTRLGYVKDVDWVELLIDVPYDEHTCTRMDKLAERVKHFSNLHVAQVNSRREYRPLVEKVFHLVNTAYDHLYGTVLLDDRQIRRYANRFIPLINPDLACFVLDEQDDLVGFEPEDYLADKGYAMAFATDTKDNVLWNAVGGSATLPQTIVLNRRGEVVYNRVDSVTPELLEALYAEAAGQTDGTALPE